MTPSICSRTLRHDNANSCAGVPYPTTQNCSSVLQPETSNHVTNHCSRRCQCSMSWNLATRTVLTIAVDHLYALPAKLGPTLSAIHVTTPSILLNALRALWTLLGLLLNGSETLILLLKTIFDAGLVLFAGFVLVPWAIARNASFGAAVLAGADIWCASGF